jgi:hypothetical protein
VRLRTAAIGIAVALSADPVGAEICARPDLIDTFPPDGAKNVPTNAVLTAHYAPTAVHGEENVTLRGPDPGGSEISVGFKDDSCANPLEPGSFCFNENEGHLVLRPPTDLEPGGAYTVTWPGLLGENTTTRGNGGKVTFTVGDGPDVEPPKFRGLEKIFWDVDRERDECTEDQQDRFYFDLTPGPVSDDFGKELLALRVFQTKGPTLRGERIKVALLPFPTDGNPVRTEISVSNATGEVCFAAQVEDLKCPDAPPPSSSADGGTGSGETSCPGRYSGGADKEVCATTISPPFFYGCALAPPSHDASGSALASRAWPLALLLLLAVRRRHRALP